MRVPLRICMPNVYVQKCHIVKIEEASACPIYIAYILCQFVWLNATEVEGANIMSAILGTTTTKARWIYSTREHDIGE
jgi:hypothetical protein